jgi:hypothetical protein
MDGDGDAIPDECESLRFLRGNASADGQTNIADAVLVLNYLFWGGAELPCAKSADSDDNGQIELADVVHLLRHIFLVGPAPGEPFSSCGLDPTEDELTCKSFGRCLDP